MPVQVVIWNKSTKMPQAVYEFETIDDILTPKRNLCKLVKNILIKSLFEVCDGTLASSISNTENPTYECP